MCLWHRFQVIVLGMPLNLTTSVVFGLFFVLIGLVLFMDGAFSLFTVIFRVVGSRSLATVPYTFLVSRASLWYHAFGRVYWCAASTTPPT